MLRSAIELGRRVQQLRKAAGLEQPDLCERAGLSRAYISRLENGAVTNPKIFDLANVARALGTTVADLAGTSGEGDAAAIRDLLGVRLGTPSAEQVGHVVDKLAERSEQDRRTVLAVIRTLVDGLPSLPPEPPANA